MLLCLLALGMAQAGLDPARYGSLPRPGLDWDKRLAELDSAIRARVPSCLAELEARFGWAWPKDSRGRARGLEIRRMELALAPDPCGGAGACTERRGSGIRVSFVPEPFLAGNQAIESTVCHEMAHAYFRRRMGERAYSRFPRWAREGSATFLAGQTSAKLRGLLVQLGTRAEERLNGLAGEHDAEDYYEDAMAFEALAELGKADEVLALALGGTGIERAIREATGIERIEGLARDRALARIGSELASLPDWSRWLLDHPWERPVGERFRAVREALGGDRALDWETLSIGTKPGFASALGLARLASSLRWSGERDLAEVAAYYLDLLNTLPFPELGIRPGPLRYDLAYLYLAIGDFERALAQFVTVVWIHDDNPILQDAAMYGVAKAYFGLEDYRRADQWFRALTPDTTYVRFERYALEGLAAFHACDRKRAIRVLRGVAEDPSGEGRGWAKRARETLDAIQGGTLVASGC